MSYEELTLSGFLKEIKDVSSGSHPRKFCFVLGAGASKSSGIRSGQDLVNQWEKDLLERNKEQYLEWKKELGINDTNKYEFYSQYYEKRFRALDGYNYLEKLMESAKPSVGYVMLSYILTHTMHNVVITTNFDHLTEDAVNYYEHTIPLVIGHESLAHYITRQINRPMIIKIHRDLLLDPKNKTAELNVLHDNLKKALDTVLSEYYPIFIGYAGNDHSLMDYLIKNVTFFSDEKEVFPYWMLYKTDTVSELVSEFLDRSGGYLIKHNGFDEVLYLLGDIFDYQLPSKDEFIRDAEKRYKMLSDAIDAFTEISASDKNMNLEEKENNPADDKENETPEVKQAIQNITSQTELQMLFKDGVTFTETGRYPEAMDVFQRLIKENSQNARYHSWLGKILHQMGRFEDARKENQIAVDLDPDEAQYHNNLGATLHEMGRLDEALKEKQMAVDLDPDVARYHNNLGVTLHQMGRLDEALKEKQMAVDLDPDVARYHNNLGTTLHEMGHLDEALKEKQMAVDLVPDEARYHNNLGVTLHQMGRLDEALKEKQMAVDLDPDKARYHNNLGTTLHQMGRLDEALKEKQMAVDLDPDKALYHNNLGTTLHEMGHYGEALKEKQKAIDLESDNIEYHDSLNVTLHAISILNQLKH